jgi:hypothetical protein
MDEQKNSFGKIPAEMENAATDDFWPSESDPTFEFRIQIQNQNTQNSSITTEFQHKMHATLFVRTMAIEQHISVFFIHFLCSVASVKPTRDAFTCQD